MTKNIWFYNEILSIVITIIFMIISKCFFSKESYFILCFCIWIVLNQFDIMNKLARNKLK